MTPTVYFLMRGDRIKVGYTTDLKRRISALSDSPDDLLATIEVRNMADEKAAHKYLGRWRITDRGEWFHATPDCLAAIQELVDGALFPYAETVIDDKTDRRRLVAQIAAHESWANTENRTARTAPARQALAQKFLDLADGDPVRAESLRKAHFRRLALKSADARRRNKGGVNA